MITLFDYLKYNNILYKDLTKDEDKAKLEKFVDYLKQADLEKTILSLTPAHQFNARWFDHNGRDFISGLPEDLSRKMIVLWMKLDEPKPLEEYRKIFPV